MSSLVALVGEGVLADFVYDELSIDYQVARQNNFMSALPLGTDLVLVLHDGWFPSAHREAEEVLRSIGIPWLRGFISFGEGVIGPLVLPNTPGCSRCADSRRFMAGRDRKEMWKLQQTLEEQGGVPIDVWASLTGLSQMAHLLVSEVRNVMQGNQGKLAERMFLINLKTLRSSSHFFLPDPECPVCSRMYDDSSAVAQISLQPSLKINANSYRCRPMDDLKAVLVKDYVDYRCGLLNVKMHDLVSPFADASVNLPLFSEDEGCAGRTHSYAESELTAILEGLERYCGMAPRGKRTIICDSYRNLEDQALNPLGIGVYSQEQYMQPGFPLKPFDPDLPINWVWGYSFLQERPILVPESIAYYSVGCGQRFIHETSNGCALGGSLEEAIFYGIMEVVERDSFLMTWYAQLPLQRLDPYSISDTELWLMIERLQTIAGYDVYLFNSTMEHGIPSVWAIAKNRKHKGVNLICAAGAHLDPLRAVKSSIHELAGMLLNQNEKFESNRENYVRMFHDPFLVREMEDHSMLYSLPEAEQRLQFLLDDDRPMRTFEEEFKPRKYNADLTDDLKDILEAFRQLNLEVIVVDQTTPELSRNGLHCVKVLIPGMLPMTFGYHLTRLTGLERVLRIPMELGYVTQPLTAEQLNPHPHPFP